MTFALRKRLQSIDHQAAQLRRKHGRDDRDWIIVHSAPFERDLIVHNIPSAAEAYRLRNGWARGPQGQRHQEKQ